MTAAYFVGQSSGTRVDVLGPDPFGYAVLEPNGRMIALLTAHSRPAPTSAAEMAALFRSMIAYTGRWSVDGDTFVTRVDGAWDPSWVGTEQVRHLTIDEGSIAIRSAPVNHPAFPDEQVVGYLEWQRELD